MGAGGGKVVQPLQYDRPWCSVLIVVDGRRGRLSWSWTLGMTTDHLAPEVAKWKGAGLDAIGWDRAPAHQTLTSRAQEVALILQPPYSPELNPAERVIEAVRQQVEGRVSASLPETYAAVNAVLAELDADPARVRALAGWDWIQDNLDHLSTPLEIAAWKEPTYPGQVPGHSAMMETLGPRASRPPAGQPGGCGTPGRRRFTAASRSAASAMVVSAACRRSATTRRLSRHARDLRLPGALGAAAGATAALPWAANSRTRVAAAPASVPPAARW
jgi:hypothetical protein